MEKKSFQAIAKSLANSWGKKDTVSFNVAPEDGGPAKMTEKEFVEAAAKFDPKMAKAVQSWLDAGVAMGDYIRSRFDK